MRRNLFAFDPPSSEYRGAVASTPISCAINSLKVRSLKSSTYPVFMFRTRSITCMSVGLINELGLLDMAMAKICSISHKSASVSITAARRSWMRVGGAAAPWMACATQLPACGKSRRTVRMLLRAAALTAATRALCAQVSLLSRKRERDRCFGITPKPIPSRHQSGIPHCRRGR